MTLPSPVQAAASPLECACTALWSATLSLMTAYMQLHAPAHRSLLARRIAANFETLSRQDSFSGATRESFARLHQRWHATASRLALPSRPEGAGLLGGLLAGRRQHL